MVPSGLALKSRLYNLNQRIGTPHTDDRGMTIPVAQNRDLLYVQAFMSDYMKQREGSL